MYESSSERTERKHGRNNPDSWGYALLLLAVATIGALPAGWAFVDLILEWKEALDALFDPLLWSRFAYTFKTCLVSLLLMNLFGLPLAWLLARTDLPTRNLLFFLLLFPLLLPPLVHVLAWFELLRWHGTLAVVALNALVYTPLTIVFCVLAFERISRDQSEFTRLHASGWRYFFWELRLGIPAALAASGLAALLIISDYATSDFLSSVGPKISSWGDSLLAQYLSSSRGAYAGTALPGLLLGLGVLLLLMRGSAYALLFSQPDHVPAIPIRLGRWRWVLFTAVGSTIALAAIFPLILLVSKTGSWEVWWAQWRYAWPAMQFSVWTGVAAASLMLLLALGLAKVQPTSSSPTVAFLILMPLATPALSFGIGLIRVWNREWLEAVYASPWIVVLAMSGRYLAVAFLPVAAAFRQLDPELLAAARLEGATRLQQFRSIVLPLTGSHLIWAWGMALCLSFRELESFLMLAESQRSLPFTLYSNVVFARKSEVAALALLQCLTIYLPLAGLLIMGRFWRRI